MTVALLSGIIAGVFLFALQHFTVVPLIGQAETYENAAHKEAHKMEQASWNPAEGWQRITWTAITTVLSSIGFAAVLFGFIALTGRPINAGRGALWGLMAFVCIVLAPGLGLPPQPPGVALADLHDRQIWWLATVVATALGLWLLLAVRPTWLTRIAGVLCLALPHLIGAPIITDAEQKKIPPQLIRQFTVTSMLTTLLFWILLGALGGFLATRPFCRSDKIPRF
jgi:cobalt transporter subunit CbtA